MDNVSDAQQDHHIMLILINVNLIVFQINTLVLKHKDVNVQINNHILMVNIALTVMVKNILILIVNHVYIVQ